MLLLLLCVSVAVLRPAVVVPLLLLAVRLRLLLVGVVARRRLRGWLARDRRPVVRVLAVGANRAGAILLVGAVRAARRRPVRRRRLLGAARDVVLLLLLLLRRVGPDGRGDAPADLVWTRRRPEPSGGRLARATTDRVAALDDDAAVLSAAAVGEVADAEPEPGEHLFARFRVVDRGRADRASMPVGRRRRGRVDRGNVRVVVLGVLKLVVDVCWPAAAAELAREEGRRRRRGRVGAVDRPERREDEVLGRGCRRAERATSAVRGSR